MAIFHQVSQAAVLLQICVMLPGVYAPPRQVKWFVGLQLVGLVFAVVAVLTVWNDLGRKPELFHLVSILLIFLSIEGLLIWKVWMGKNWARLTMLAWFLLSWVGSYFQHSPAPTPIHVRAGLMAIGITLSILQAFSFVTLFINPANEWFRPAPAKESLLFPR